MESRQKQPGGLATKAMSATGAGQKDYVKRYMIFKLYMADQ